MNPLRRHRPSPAMIVALLALFMALGGSSYGALRIGSKQIANNSVHSKDIRNHDVRGRDLRDGSLLAKDFGPGQLSIRRPRRLKYRCPVDDYRLRLPAQVEVGLSEVLASMQLDSAATAASGNARTAPIA